MCEKCCEICVFLFGASCSTASPDVLGRETSPLCESVLAGETHRHIAGHEGAEILHILSLMMFKYSASEPLDRGPDAARSSCLFFSVNGCGGVWGVVGRNSADAITFDPLFH